MLMYNARLTFALADEAVCQFIGFLCVLEVYVIPTFHFPQISESKLTSLRMYSLGIFVSRLSRQTNLEGSYNSCLPVCV